MKSRQSGLSLVEILVAVVIGLVGILAMTQAYIMSDRFNRATMGEGSAQINGLLALYQLERDLRMAGYGIASSSLLACGIIDWYYDPNYSPSINPSSPLSNLTLAPVVITTNGTNPDTITVMYGSSPERLLPVFITGFVAPSSEVTVDGTYGFNTGDLILLVNSSSPVRCTLGKVTQVQAGPQKIQLNPGASAPYNPPAWGSFPGTYAAGDLMMNLGNPVVRTYSINNNKLRVSDALLSAAGETPLDLVDSIVDMRAQYGKDNGGSGGTANDGRVDEYNTVAPTTAEQWQQVISLRMAILARVGVYEKPASGTNCDATTASNAPTWAGGSFSKMDFSTATSEDRCYRYRVYETVIPLRNMIWRAQ